MRYNPRVRQLRLRLGRKRPLAVAPDIAHETWIFICGLHRSGTSVVHRLVRCHSCVTGIAGSVAPEDEGQHLQHLLPSDRAFNGVGNFAFDEAAHLDETADLDRDEVRRHLARHWGPYLDCSKAFYVEKSPINLIRTRFLKTVFPRARFVVIVRHPIPTALATAKMKRQSILKSLLHWSVAHRIFIKDLSYLKEVIVIRYEDLVADPALEMKKIWGHVGLDPITIDEMIVDRNHFYFQRWENENRGYQMHGFEDFALLDRWGYLMTRPFVLPPPADAGAPTPAPAAPLSGT